MYTIPVPTGGGAQEGQVPGKFQGSCAPFARERARAGDHHDGTAEHERERIRAPVAEKLGALAHFLNPMRRPDRADVRV